MLILHEQEQVPSKQNLLEQLLAIVPLGQLKETPLSVITKEDLVNHFFTGQVVSVRETLRPMGVVRVSFGSDQTPNKIFCQARSLDGIIMAKEQAQIAYIKKGVVYVENLDR